MTLNPGVALQYMTPTAAAATGADPLVGLKLAATTVQEGGTVNVTVERTRNLATPCQVRWAATAGAGDLTGVTSAVLAFVANATAMVFSVHTINRPGSQGDRNINLSLSSPEGCSIDPARSSAVIVLQDVTAPVTSDWWRLAIPSGRDWASGVSLIGATTGLTEVETFLNAPIDFAYGHSAGSLSNYCDTWDELIGAPLAAAGIDSLGAETQLGWLKKITNFSIHLDAPTGAAYPDGSRWLVWGCWTIPLTERTDTGDASIWAEITAGTWSAYHVKMGERIAAMLAAKGQPLKRLIICLNPEMNKSQSYQVFASTRYAYKTAMEKVIADIRTGLGSPLPKFCHFVAQEQNLGPLVDWVPAGIDCLGMSFLPDNRVYDTATLGKMIDGTLNSSMYGITTDLLAAATELGLPVMLPYWGPKWEWGTAVAEQVACPIADEAITTFVDDVMIPLLSPRLIGDAPRTINPFRVGAYQGPDEVVEPPPPGVPGNTVAPSIASSGGTALGSTLTLNVGTWTNSPTYAYRWERDGTTIAGQTGTTYLTSTADAGATLGAVVVASNGAGDTTVRSNTIDMAAVVVPGTGWVLSGSSSDAGDALGSTPTTVDVDGATQLRAALLAANAGTRIRCKAGTYTGDFTFNKPGTGNSTTGVVNQPIYIMAFDPSVDATVSTGVNFTGRITLDKAWTGVIGRGIRVSSVIAKALGVRVSRCAFKGSCNIDFQNGAKLARCDRNWAEDFTGIWCSGSMTPGHNMYGIRVYMNHIDGHTIPDPGASAAQEAVINLLTDSYGDSHLSIDGNRFDDCMKNPSGQLELVSIKTGSVFYRNNTVVNTVGRPTLRETRDCVVSGNWLGAGAVILVLGATHTIKNNHGAATNAQIRLDCGDGINRNPDGSDNYGEPRCNPASSSPIPWKAAQKWKKSLAVVDNGKCEGGHAAAMYCLVEDNSCRIDAGVSWDGPGGTNDKPVKGCTFRGNKYGWNRTSTAAVPDYSGDAPGTTHPSLPTQANQIPAPSKNSSDKVGPWATTVNGG